MSHPTVVKLRSELEHSGDVEVFPRGPTPSVYNDQRAAGAQRWAPEHSVSTETETASADYYLADRFGKALSRLPVVVRREVVGELTDAGLSTRAIAAVTGTDHSTVSRDRAAAAGVARATPLPTLGTETGEISNDYLPDDATGEEVTPSSQAHGSGSASTAFAPTFRPDLDRTSIKPTKCAFLHTCGRRRHRRGRCGFQVEVRSGQSGQE